MSTIWSAECCWTHSCGLTPARRSGRDPVAGTSSTSMAKYWVPATWGVGCSGTWPCSTPRSHPPLLAMLCPRGAAWWFVSARSMATVSRSCRRNWRNRRSRRLLAVPASSAQRADHIDPTERSLVKNGNANLSSLLLLLLLCVVCCVLCVVCCVLL